MAQARTPPRVLGLNHLALAVRDPAASATFYSAAFGCTVYADRPDQVQVKGPGPNDVLAFFRDPEAAGRTGGLNHFGFRLAAPQDLPAVVEVAVAAGGVLKRQGEFAPGVPFAYVADPDGYEIEIWWEP
jgi:catechol 2,3-dioxygenase-like lactoylglutathione lyase family enzyme